MIEVTEEEKQNGIKFITSLKGALSAELQASGFDGKLNSSSEYDISIISEAVWQNDEELVAVPFRHFQMDCGEGIVFASLVYFPKKTIPKKVRK